MNFYNVRSRQATEGAGLYATVLQRNNLRRIKCYHQCNTPLLNGYWAPPGLSLGRQLFTAARPRPEPNKYWTTVNEQVSNYTHARSAIATAAAGGNFYGTGGSRPGHRTPWPVATVSAAPRGGLDDSSLTSHAAVNFRQGKTSSSSSASSYSSFVGWLSFWQQWVTQNVQSVHQRVGFGYRLMRLFQLPTWGKLLMLVLVGLPIVVLGASLLVRVTNMAWGEAAQMVFYVLQSVPGVDITGFSQAARSVLVVIHLLSLYTFAALVGLLTEDVRSTVEGIRRGNSPIASRDHTVLLDGSRDPVRLMGTLQRVLEMQADLGANVYGGEVAVLSTHPKDELDKMIVDMLPEQCGRVVTRQGNPVKVADLERVAAAHASTVLLLMPDGPMGCVGPALQQQLCLTALRSIQDQHSAPTHQHSSRHPRVHSPPESSSRHSTSTQPSSSPPAAPPPTNFSSSGNVLGPGDGGSRAAARLQLQQQRRGWRGRRQRVVVESGSSVTSVVTAESEEEDPLEVTYVSSTSSTSRIAVQCAVQPGLAAVYDAVFCRADGASLRLVDLPADMEGRTFAHARRRFVRAALCGVLPGPSAVPDSSAGGGSGRSGGGGGGCGGIVLSPSDGLVLGRSDRLVLLAASRRDCVPLSREVLAPKLPRRVTQFDAHHARPRRLILLALDSYLAPAMMGALNEFGSREGSVTVVSPQPCAGLPPAPAPNGMTIQNVVGDPLSPGPLLAVDVATADAVILAGTDGMPPEEADAVAIGVALLLKRVITDPRVMSRGGSEGIAAAAAAVASIDPEDYWGNARLDSDNISGFSSFDIGETDSSAAMSVEMDDDKDAEGDRPRSRRPPPQSSRPSLTFVCSLRDPQNRSVLQHIGIETCRTAEAAVLPGSMGTDIVPRGSLSIEVLEPKALVSGLLAQVGAEPCLESALEDLLDQEGYEIYIKGCEHYGLVSGSHVSWAQVNETVRGKGDVALGYLHRGQLQLAPPADLELRPSPADQLVVLAEDL